MDLSKRFSKGWRHGRGDGLKSGVPYLMYNLPYSEVEEDVEAHKRKRGYESRTLYNVFNGEVSELDYNHIPNTLLLGSENERVVNYACGKGGWVITVDMSQGWDVKLVNVFHKDFVLQLPTLEPHQYIKTNVPLSYNVLISDYDWSADEYDEEDLIEYAIDELESWEKRSPDIFSYRHYFRKFVLDGDPSKQDQDFSLVVLFGHRFSVEQGAQIEAAYLVKKQTSSPPAPAPEYEWVPALLEAGYLYDVAFHRDMLLVVGTGASLTCFPKKPSLIDKRRIVMPLFSTVYWSPPFKDRVFTCVYSQTYLVDCSNELLCVYRLNGNDPWSHNRFSCYPDLKDPYRPFVVHSLTVDCDGSLVHFEELKDLGKRSLFLGDNASFAIEVPDSDSDFKFAKPNRIYFSDHLARLAYDNRNEFLNRVESNYYDVGYYDLGTNEVYGLPGLPYLGTVKDTYRNTIKPTEGPSSVPQWLS